MTVTSDAAPVDGTALLRGPSGFVDRVQHALHRYPVLSPTFVLLVSCVVFTVFGEGRFQRPETIGIILQQTAVLATLAIGQTLIILTAGVDLAVGTAMLLTHLVIAKVFLDHGVPSLLALLLGAVVGITLGAAHGNLVTKIGLPPFIVTLGTFYIFNSLGLVFSKAQTISKEQLGGPDGLLLWTGKGISIGSMRITTGVLVALVMYLVFAYVLGRTAWGRHVYATGDDKEAARLAGIDVGRVLISVYMVAGLVYAVGGWVQLGRSLSASSNAAADINLETITAVVIGGTSLFGGRGRLWGTLVGALIVTVFRIGLSLAGVDPYWQNFAIGSLILIAVGLDQWIRKVAS
jgi:fructose transport system permease protein